MLLLTGVLLWSALHLCASLRVAGRAALIDRFGLGPYKGMFALCVVLALVLIVAGWRGMTPVYLYVPPAGLRHLAMLLMPVAVILFIGARFPSDIRRHVRHPQLTGVKLWAVAHLLANGDTRSFILFGGMLAWAVAEVIVINRREGPRVPPEPAGKARTAAHVALGLVVTAVLVFAHPWLAGIPLVSGG